MKYIKELTVKQKEMMPVWVKNWIEIGLRTGETDWETFDKYIPICYAKAGLKFPNKIIRVHSPLVGALASSIAGKILNSNTVDGAVNSAVGGAVRGAVDDAVGGAVDGAVGDAVDGAVSDAVNDVVRDAVDDAKLQWHYWFGGQFWVGGYYWGSPAYVSFFTDVCKLELSQDIFERAEAYRKICESVNYFWCNKYFIMVCSRPKHIHLNSRGQLHCENGKAIEYPDGWGLYMLNGIRMPKEIVETPAEKLDPKLALNEKNTDVQREIIRKIGYERILKACNAKTLEEWSCPKTDLKYKIQEMKVGEINRRYLCYEHASIPGVFYAKCIPPEAKTIIQMRAFQTGVFGFEPDKARENLRNNKLTDEQLLEMLPISVQ